MECNRHKDIDILKGIGIILVVLGHSGFPYIYCNFFYQFHMAIFFMASGYCWNKKNSASIVTCKKYIFRKFKTLYLPYVVYNGIFLLLNNVLIKLGIYTTNSDFLILAACTNGGKYDWGIGEHMKIAHLIKEFIKVIFFGGKTQLGGALWFLRALFVITVGHCIYEYYIIKINSKLRIVLIGMLCLLCYIVYELYANGIIKGRYMHIVISMTLAYMVYIIGMLFRYLEEKKLFEVNIWIAITAMLLLTKCTSFGKISIGDAYVTNIPYFLTVSVCGWYLTIWISRILSAWHGGGGMAYLGRHTMPIIALHFLCFKLVTFFYLLISGKSILLLAYFPTLPIENYLWIFYTLIGVIIPVCIEQIWNFVISILCALWKTALKLQS